MEPIQVMSWLLYAIGFAAWLFVVVQAFQDELWKGVASLLCGLYALYYAWREMDHGYSGWVLAAMIAGWAGGRMIPFLAAMQQVGAS
jgi:hypothetical protein